MKLRYRIGQALRRFNLGEKMKNTWPRKRSVSLLGMSLIPCRWLRFCENTAPSFSVPRLVDVHRARCCVSFVMFEDIKLVIAQVKLYRVLLPLAVLFLCGYANASASKPVSVAVIGTGDMGDSLGPQLARNGYQVIYGSRKPERESIQKLIALSPGARATSQTNAAQEADVVLLVVPWPAMETVAQSLGKLDNKVLIDASIPYRMGKDGYLESSVNTSSSELIQEWNPLAKVVKVGFPGSFLIDEPLLMGEAPSVLIAGDDKDAKKRVALLINDIGLLPLDAGPLRHARHIEAMGLLYMVPLLQGRAKGWEFFVRKNSHWPCTLAGGALYGANASSPDKAEMPGNQHSAQNCTGEQ